MTWLCRLVWIGVSLYGSLVIGRQLLAVLRRREQLEAFRSRPMSLTWLRVQLAGIWAVTSAAWTVLLAFTPVKGVIVLP